MNEGSIEGSIKVGVIMDLTGPLAFLGIANWFRLTHRHSEKQAIAATLA